MKTGTRGLEGTDRQALKRKVNQDIDTCEFKRRSKKLLFREAGPPASMSLLKPFCAKDRDVLRRGIICNPQRLLAHAKKAISRDSPVDLLTYLCSMTGTVYGLRDHANSEKILVSKRENTDDNDPNRRSTTH